MGMSPYPYLLSPLDLGFALLPNRVVMGSMHVNLEEVEGGFERMAAFYAERARGGVALIITGGIDVVRHQLTGGVRLHLASDRRIDRHDARLVMIGKPVTIVEVGAGRRGGAARGTPRVRFRPRR